jgi:uncharacterized protein
MINYLYASAEDFLDYIVNCTENETFWSFAVLDHICFRAASDVDYENKKLEFSSLGSLFSENIVNGRKISVFKTVVPLQNSSLETTVLELAQPKKGASHRVGFEHIELVVSIDLRSLVEQNPHLNFYTKNINDKVPEIRLNFLKGTIKFRNIGLEKILGEE